MQLRRKWKKYLVVFQHQGFSIQMSLLCTHYQVVILDSILDIETGLINTNIIDEVSNELAIQFDHLLDIDA